MTGTVVDQRRAGELRRYEVLSRPPRRDLVALAEVAAQVAGVSMASVNLLDDAEQHQVATVGFPGIVCAREDSMCNVVLHEAGPVVVEDARRDPRFAANKFVTGELGSVRFYAAHPLRTPAGTTIGMLCVLDTQPRTLDAHQQRALAHLAERVVDLLELEVRTRDLERRTRELTVAVDGLRSAQAELQRSNRQLAAFAGQVSHDLSNPLTAVAMSLSILDEQVQDPDAEPDRVRYVVDRAARATERMRALIDDLLAFARVDGGLAVGETDLGGVVEEVREDLAGPLAGVTLQVGPLPVVTGDKVQLRAVLQNLVGNAAKFRAPGVAPLVEVRAERRGDRWRVSVADNGLGIPVDARARVFEPFERTYQDVPGSGLGLATVRRVVEAHGGRVGADDTPGGGATVWFELPATAALS